MYSELKDKPVEIVCWLKIIFGGVSWSELRRNIKSLKPVEKLTHEVLVT